MIEVRSKSDSLDDLLAKMEVWVSNGTNLAWLIDPIRKTAYVFKPNSELKKIAEVDKLIGEGLVDGFIFDLLLVKL